MDPSIIDSRKEMLSLADCMSQELRDQDRIISRVFKRYVDNKVFSEGKEIQNLAGLNFIHMDMENLNGEFCFADGMMLNSDNYFKRAVGRDLQRQRLPLPDQKLPFNQQIKLFYGEVPTKVDVFDQELLKLSGRLDYSVLERNFLIEQRIVVNPKGGVAIESIPHLSISFHYTLNPTFTHRHIGAVVNTTKDVENFTSLIKYIPDPTPDKRIQKATTFTEAFTRLHDISTPKYASLKDAGVKLQTLYDVIMENGIAIHEIFGHSFEIPAQYLNSGDSATFIKGQDIMNPDIVLSDEPLTTVEGFKLPGFSHFDAYGRDMRSTTHIKDSKVREYLASEYVDHASLKSYCEETGHINGNARSCRGIPQARMTCTNLFGKTEDVDYEGKIVVVPEGGQSFPANKSYQVRCTEAYVVRNGEPQRIMPINVSGGIMQALSDMSLLENVTLSSGICERSDLYNHAQTEQVPVSQYANSQLWKRQQVFPTPINEKLVAVLMNP